MSQNHLEGKRQNSFLAGDCVMFANFSPGPRRNSGPVGAFYVLTIQPLVPALVSLRDTLSWTVQKSARDSPWLFRGDIPVETLARVEEVIFHDSRSIFGGFLPRKLRCRNYSGGLATIMRMAP
jgi:hypothetical protein